MSFFEEYIRQCRKPAGKLGMFVGKTMNLGHTGVRHWGLKHIELQSNSYVLDIGCGGGKAVFEMAAMCQNGKVYGIDYSEDMVELSKKTNMKFLEKGSVEINHGNVSELPYADNMFDIVTAVETYYFWPDMINDMKEIKRVLKPGGQLLLVNEAYRDERFEKRNSKWGGLLDIKFHTPEEFRSFLNKAGYRSVEIDRVPEKNWIAVTAEK